MNYQEAKTLAEAWTKDHDTELEGWRSVIAVLLQRINTVESANKELNGALAKMQLENESLSLDLGIKDQDFRLPPQPQLKTIADIIKECEGK